MLDRQDVVYAGRNLVRTLWAGLAIWGLLSIASMPFTGVVIGMHPVEGSWCQADHHVQARFQGLKVQGYWPIAGSESGEAKIAGYTFDTHFEFVDDPTPGSSKPRGYQGFGVWRWNTAMPDEVRMTMRHTNGEEEVLSSFGFFPVPENIPDCDEAVR